MTLYFVGCIPANELKFVFEHLPGRISFDEIDDMIHTVDRNGDSKISFSEFRYSHDMDFLFTSEPVIVTIKSA